MNLNQPDYRPGVLRDIAKRVEPVFPSAAGALRDIANSFSDVGRPQTPLTPEGQARECVGCDKPLSQHPPGPPCPPKPPPGRPHG